MGLISRVMALLRPLDARDEGLAAGTGLLTGSVAEKVATEVVACPQCGKPAVVDVLDLVDREARYVCTACAYRWTVRDLSSHGGR
jgi:predicted RNA-binding Zn-ribbon protein involved in translation (DUF1610 family)